MQNEVKQVTPKAVFSVVEKEHPRSLTPMLWAKKLAMIFPKPVTERFFARSSTFLDIKRRAHAWEQWLRHLQRDRRTEPAVDLTVSKNSVVLQLSSASAAFRFGADFESPTATTGPGGENFCDQWYLPMRALRNAEPEPMVLSVTLLCV
uniref:Uncharacterized protein n=1 Tax=Leersia perrieri TaxID=77586 RepID=A0A0D9W9K0_9ORYZ